MRGSRWKTNPSSGFASAEIHKSSNHRRPRLRRIRSPVAEDSQFHHDGQTSRRRGARGATRAEGALQHHDSAISMLHKKVAVWHLHHREDDLAAAHRWLPVPLAGAAAGPTFR